MGLQATAEITPDLQVSSWTGLMQAIATDRPRNRDATILNWPVTISNSDILGEDNLRVQGVTPNVLPTETCPLEAGAT